MLMAQRRTHAEPPECRSESHVSVRLTREQVVERIMAINAGASARFLQSFRDGALREYLAHLLAAQVPRGREARWLRPDGRPGIVCRVPAE